MLGLALQALLAAFICYYVQWTFGQPMIDQPIVAGLVCGIVFGDITTGIMIGAALQVIFMGSVNVGGATSADPCTGTVMAVCFVTKLGIDQASAITLGTAVAIVANIWFGLCFNVLSSFWAPVTDWAASTGEEKSVFLAHFGGGLLFNLLYSLPSFLGVYLGAEPVANLINVIPPTVTSGFNAIAGLLPCVGMAILIRMLWDNKIAVYFLLGFVLVEYLGLPMIAVAAIGVVIIVVTAVREMENLDLQKKIQSLRKTGVASSATSQADMEEEDFFA